MPFRVGASIPLLTFLWHARAARAISRITLQAAQDNLGKAPAQALADTGYRSEAVFEHLADGAGA